MTAQTRLRNGQVINSDRFDFMNGGRNPGLVQILLDLPLVSDVMGVAGVFGLDPRDLIAEIFDILSGNDDLINAHFPQLAGVDADELSSASQCRLFKIEAWIAWKGTVTYSRAIIDNQNPEELEVNCFPQAD